MKTKERIAFDEMNNKVIAISEIIHKSIEAAVDKALNLGFVVTIDPTPRQPLAMGNYDLAITTSLNRVAQRQLDDLEAAAIASEASEASQRADCEAGFHSWVSEPDVIDPNATCTGCGERYGDPIYGNPD